MLAALWCSGCARCGHTRSLRPAVRKVTRQAACSSSRGAGWRPPASPVRGSHVSILGIFVLRCRASFENDEGRLEGGEQHSTALEPKDFKHPKTEGTRRGAGVPVRSRHRVGVGFLEGRDFYRFTPIHMGGYFYHFTRILADLLLPFYYQAQISLRSLRALCTPTFIHSSTRPPSRTSGRLPVLIPGAGKVAHPWRRRARH